MAHIQTIEQLAAELYPKLLDTGEGNILPAGFFEPGQKITRENWKQALDAAFRPAVTRHELGLFLSAPPTMHESTFAQHQAQLEFTFTKLGNFEERDIPFDPTQDMSERLLEKRTTHANLFEIFSVLEENPHFFATIAHLHNFYGHYIRKLEKAVLAQAREGDDVERVTKALKKLKNITMANHDFFVHNMLFQYVLVHRGRAMAEGRPLGDFTQSDFMAVDRYTREAKLFTQKGGKCPFGYAHKQTMLDKDADGQLISGINLWRLHQHIAPFVAEHRDELRGAVQRSATLFRDEMAGRAERKTCPYRAVTAA